MSGDRWSHTVELGGGLNAFVFAQRGAAWVVWSCDPPGIRRPLTGGSGGMVWMDGLWPDAVNDAQRLELEKIFRRAVHFARGE
jgi:hypothetical protein